MRSFSDLVRILEQSEGWRSAKLKADSRRAQQNGYFQMHYVYFLRSIRRPGKTYVGHTGDLEARLAAHNAGSCPSTSRFRPWQLVAYIAVLEEERAIGLERYFKSGSGHAFWRKRFLG